MWEFLGFFLKFWKPSEPFLRDDKSFLFAVRFSLVADSTWSDGRRCQRRLRNTRSTQNSTQSCHPVCISGPIRGGCSVMQAGARGSREDQRARPSRRGYHAKHPGFSLQVTFRLTHARDMSFFYFRLYLNGYFLRSVLQRPE